MTCDRLVIRPAQPAEYSNVTVVAPMHLRSWKKCYGSFVPKEHLDQFNAFGVIDEYDRLINEQRLAMWLATSAGTPVGVAIFGPDPSDRGRGWIEALYVAPERWHKRTGKRLLKRILDELDYTVVDLMCATENESGRRFWMARGFRLNGEIGGFPIQGYGDVETLGYTLDRDGSPLFWSRLRRRWRCLRGACRPHSRDQNGVSMMSRQPSPASSDPSNPSCSTKPSAAATRTTQYFANGDRSGIEAHRPGHIKAAHPTLGGSGLHSAGRSATRPMARHERGLPTRHRTRGPGSRGHRCR
jgi:GNAT superfamily N-acetyltransferase